MSEMQPLAGADPGPSTEPDQPAREPISAKKIRERWDRSCRATREIREQASVNEQFILNRQWLRWNRASGRLEELPRNPDRVRITVNRLGPDSHRLLAKLTNRHLRWDVPPHSPDDASIQAARIAEQALAQTCDEQAWEDIRYDHALATWQGGVAGVMVEWDRRAGTPIAMDEGRPIATGEVKLTCVPVHEIGVEPGTRQVEKALWWVHARAMPPEEVQDLFELADKPAADARAIDSVWRIHDAGQTSHTPLTMVYTLYERPSSLRDGQIVTCVGDEIVDQAPWYFPFSDRLNIATCRVQPVSGKWWGHTPVTDAVPVQTAMNGSWSSIVEHLKQAGNARMWAPEGTLDNPEDLTDAAGEYVEYNPVVGGAGPRYEAPPVMPEWWIRSPDQLGRALDDILGQHDVSRGIAPSGVESGIAMSLLSENDDTPIGRFIINMASMWGRVGSMVLELYEVFVRDTRTAQIRMPNNRIPEAVKWNGGKLMGHTTAVVPIDAVTPRNRNAQAAYAFQLNDRGIVTNPIELAKIADLPDQDDLIAGIDPDTARAMRENHHMAAGAARTVDSIDDHTNHLIHHRNFMRSERFEQLPPEQQMIFRMHNAAHEQYAAQAAAQLTQAASVSPMAAALPSESPMPIDPNAVAEAAMLSQMSPSAATAGLGMEQPPTDLAAAQLGGMGGPPGQGTPPAPDTRSPQAAMTQDLLEEQPPQ